jgi:hypothetical protein
MSPSCAFPSIQLQNWICGASCVHRFCNVWDQMGQGQSESFMIWFLCHSDMLSLTCRLPLWSSGQSSWLHNGDILCFLCGTNWIYICYVEESRPPLWSSGQSSWLQIQRSGFDSRHYQIFWDVAGLERGPLSLVSTTEELLEGKTSGSVIENGEYGRKNLSCWPCGTL